MNARALLTGHGLKMPLPKLGVRQVRVQREG